jgi:hypothetical protein
MQVLLLGLSFVLHPYIVPIIPSDKEARNWGPSFDNGAVVPLVLEARI